MVTKALKEKINNIKLVVTDIDGVWTDGKFYYTDEGYFLKGFSTYDGMAVELLRNANIDTAIITSELSPTVQSRADKLSINYVFLGEHHKLKRVKYLCKILEIELSNIAFIGDDVNDLDSLKSVGLSAMPPNSPILDQFNPDYITTRIGGEGAFRDFADLILQNK